MKTALKQMTASAASAGVMAMSLISTAWAQTAGITGGASGGEGFAGDSPNITGLPDAAEQEDVRNVIIAILEAVLSFLALIAVVVIVIAGIRLILSQGEDEQKDKAKKTILYAIVGLVIILFARVIVSLVTVYLAGEVSDNI